MILGLLNANVRGPEKHLICDSQQEIFQQQDIADFWLTLKSNKKMY